MKHCLPNFVIAGAPRCGTTYLARMVGQHPDVYLASLGQSYSAGDIHFFDISKTEGRVHWGRGIEWYESLFADGMTQRCVGEKTADYLADPAAPGLIRETLGPETRFILSLREPVNRALSHYWHERHNLPINMDFEKAFFDAEVNRQIWLRQSGLYYENIRRYLQFFPRDNILVLINEEFACHPGRALRTVCQFLNIDPGFSFLNTAERVNRSIRSGSALGLAFAGTWIKRLSPALFRAIRDSALSGWATNRIRRARGLSQRGEH
ncbi:MAG: sulfotransferase domain-containing protein, partial [Gammaproteobacteria bacterium]